MGRDLTRADDLAESKCKAVQQEDQALLFSIFLIVEHCSKCIMYTAAPAAHNEHAALWGAVSNSLVKQKAAQVCIADNAGRCQAAIMLN